MGDINNDFNKLCREHKDMDDEEFKVALANLVVAYQNAALEVLETAIIQKQQIPAHQLDRQKALREETAKQAGLMHRAWKE